MLEAVEKKIALSLLYRFAPTLRFHPQERWFPTSMEKTWASVAKNNDLSGSVINNDTPQFEPVVVAQVKADSLTNKVYLQYWFYYTWDCSQCFKISQTDGSETWFEWSPIAEHQSDFETVTLELNPNLQQIDRIMAFAHGKSKWEKYVPNKVQTEYNPLLYVALNSHAMYLKEKSISYTANNKVFTKYISGLMKFISGGRANNLEIVDVVEARHQILTSSKYPNKDVKNQQRKSIQNLDVSKCEIKLIDPSVMNAPWIQWKGTWGQKTNQKDIQFPPEGVHEREWLKAVVGFATRISLTNGFIKNLEAGVAPWFRTEWKNISEENTGYH